MAADLRVLGSPVTALNPVPVVLSSSSSIAVQTTHLDNSPNPGDVHDSMRLGDGVGELTLTPTVGSVKFAADTVDLAKPFTKPWNKVRIASKNDDGDPLTIITSDGATDVQLATITYDIDGDFQELVVSNL